MPAELLFAYQLFSISLAIIYALLMLRYYWYWQQLSVFEIPENYQANRRISVLVPARNEEANIGACIQSILAQNYPADLFELVVINDHSTDATASKVEAIDDPRLRLIHLKDYLQSDAITSYKKKSIETGIAQTKGTLIVATDADCLVPENWLLYLAAFHEKTSARFIAAPVNFHQEKSLLERFQSLDFVGMMGITGAGIQGQFMRMCNGANLAYEREAFEAVGGFDGIDQLASGDDMLLMQKVAQQFPNGIAYLKNRKATVLTKAQPDWPSFLNQRIRWGSKSGSYHEWQVIAILAMVFFFCCNILLSAALIPFLGRIAIELLLVQLLIKSLIDFIFLRQMAAFFNRSNLMSVFWPAQFLHILYIAWVGLMSNLKKEYLWKGRKVR